MKNNVIRAITTLFAIILTAKLGTIQYGDHRETWYDLDMSRVIERANAYYDVDEDTYEVRSDGVKTYNGYVIVAADKSIPYGTVVETSRGIGIVLDYHETDKDVYDLAVSWRKGVEK